MTTYLYKITKFILFYFRLTRILIYLLHPNYKKFKIFQRLNLNKNSIFIDIGGNQGIIAQYINDFFNCKIFIYEPHPGCIKVIKRKFQNNKNIFIKNMLYQILMAIQNYIFILNQKVKMIYYFLNHQPWKKIKIILIKTNL